MLEILKRNGDEITLFESDLQEFIMKCIGLNESDIVEEHWFTKNMWVVFDKKTGIGVGKELGYEGLTLELKAEMKKELIDAIYKQKVSK